MESILRVLDTQMTQPTPYGWFHILCLVLTVVATVLLCRFGKNWKPRKVVLVTAITVVILEIYKQVNFSFSYENGIAFDYQWYAFPFQFCSTPMYVGLLGSLLKKGKLQKACFAYLATYAVFAGVCVMLYPVTVFVPEIGINIQTMICHGSMIVIGVWLLYSGHVEVKHKTILKAIPVFAVCVTLAVVMNEIAHSTGLLERETFDMFFISPYYNCTLPILSTVYQLVPYVVFVCIYFFGFILCALLVYSLIIGITHCVKRFAKSHTSPGATV